MALSCLYWKAESVKASSILPGCKARICTASHVDDRRMLQSTRRRTSKML